MNSNDSFKNKTIWVTGGAGHLGAPITEALDAEGNEFSAGRMIESVRASAQNGAPAVIAQLIEDLRTFVGSHPQNDDITLIAIRKT